MMLSSLVLALFLSPTSHAAEADNFTARRMDVADIAEPMNALANGYLKKAVADANLGGACDEGRLYEELQKFFANHSSGRLIQDVLYKKKVPLTVIPLKESIYKEWDIWDGYLLGRSKAAKSPLALTPMVRVGDTIVGVDKFEHLFGMGFIYFDKYYRKGESLRSVLKNGVFREKTALGGNMFATGVFSYADLSANFNGLRFWNHMLQKKNDVLGKNENLGPYVKCDAGKWAVNPSKSIDFRNYMDASMDESINCSKFARSSGEEKFRKSLTRLSFVDAEGNTTCPVEPAKLEAMKTKYDAANSGIVPYLDLTPFVVNSRGTEKVSYINEVQPLWYTIQNPF